MPPAENPNEYDDEQFLRYSTELFDAVMALWDAGATVENIEAEFKNAIDNIED